MTEHDHTNSSVVVSDDGAVRLIEINRPDRKNALDEDTYVALTAALSDAAIDPSICCAVLSGRGDAFCAGVDLADLDGSSDDRAYQDFIIEIERFAKPLLAAVHGIAVGIGTTMLGHCDIVLADESTRFRAPFTALGISPEAGSSETLPRLLGRQAASHLLFTSGWLGASDACDRGLVYRCTPDGTVHTETMTLAHEIARHPIEAVSATKRLLLAARMPATTAARQREDPVFSRLLEQRRAIASRSQDRG